MDLRVRADTSGKQLQQEERRATGKAEAGKTSGQLKFRILNLSRLLTPSYKS